MRWSRAGTGKSGGVCVIYFSRPSAVEARRKTGLSQSQFTKIMGVSVHTLQNWEQERQTPSGMVRTLLAIVATNLQAILAVTEL